MVIGTKIVFLAVGSVFLAAAAGLERSVAATKDQPVGSKIDEMAFQTNFLELNTGRSGQSRGSVGPARSACFGRHIRTLDNRHPDGGRDLLRDVAQVTSSQN
jgi:hypothetical protein